MSSSEPAISQSSGSSIWALQSGKRSSSAAENFDRDAKRLKVNSCHPLNDDHETRPKKKKKKNKRKKKATIVAEAEERSGSNSSGCDVAGPSRRLSGSQDSAFNGISEPENGITGSSGSETISTIFNGSPEAINQAVVPIDLTVTIPSLVDKGKAKASDIAQPEPLSSQLPEDKIALLTQELEAKTALITKHQVTLSQLQQSITCQVCLDLMYKPYALAPCGHLACYDCLVRWFTATSGAAAQDGHVPPAHLRRKTCPHCRAVVRERPVEIYGVKSIVTGLAKSELLAGVTFPPDASPNAVENGQQTAVDPWAGIFRRVPEILNFRDQIPINPAQVRRPAQGSDMGMYDAEDGGIYRCFDCMHEICDGICSSCGRLYNGHVNLPHQHANRDADFDVHDLQYDALNWMEHFDYLVNRPTYGEDDDEGDLHDLHELREGEEENYSEIDEDEEVSQDSFIDDDDNEGIRVRVSRAGGRNVIRLQSDDEFAPPNPPLRRRRRMVERIVTSDEAEDDEEDENQIIGRVRRRGPPEHSHVVIFSSDEEIDEDEEPPTRSNRARSTRRRNVTLGSDEEQDYSSQSASQDRSELHVNASFDRETRLARNEPFDDDGSIPGPSRRLRHLYEEPPLTYSPFHDPTGNWSESEDMEGYGQRDEEW